MSHKEPVSFNKLLKIKTATIYFWEN